MSAELVRTGERPITNPAWEFMEDVPPDNFAGRFGMQGYALFDMQALREGGDMSGVVAYRDHVVRRWAWAIPAPESIAFILEILDGRSVVEMGAGNGYWAWLLFQSGVAVNAYDRAPVGHELSWFKPTKDATPNEFYPVEEASIEALGWPENHDRVLFLCWPTYDSPFAYEAVKAFRGDTVIYIGEDAGGCNANDAFFDLMEKPYWSDELASGGDAVQQEWEEVATGPLRQWFGIHDRLRVFRRIT